MFELDDEEVENLSRCKNFTLNMGRGLNIKYKPYVFTEQGVYMLMTVLRGELAIKQSRALGKTFKKMKDYILENRDLIGQREILQLSMETANNRIEINKINSDMMKSGLCLMQNLVVQMRYMSPFISRQSRQYMSLTIILD